RHGRAHLLVDREKTLRVGLQAGLLEREPRAERPPPDGRNELIALDRVLALLRLDADEALAGLVLEALRKGLGQERDIHLLQRALDHLDALAVLPGQRA